MRSPASSELSFGFLTDLRLPYVGQWNVSLERAIGTHSAVSVGYVGSSANRLIRREAGGAGSTATSLVALTTNRGESNYHGLQAQYRRRMSRERAGDGVVHLVPVSRQWVQRLVSVVGRSGSERPRESRISISATPRRSREVGSR